MTADGFPESPAQVRARPVDEKGMKEDSVALLHVQRHPLQVLLATHPVVHPVHRPVVGIVVLQQGALVSARVDHEAPVRVIDPLHRGPSGHDAVLRSEGEVVEVLVHRESCF